MEGPAAVALWTAMNRPRPFEPRVVRIGCAILCAYYVLMAWLRHEPSHPDFACVRGAIAAYGLLGVLVAGRLSFTGLRIYAIALAFVISLGGAWVGAVLGQPPAQLPLTGLSSFIGTAFLQTALDVSVVVPLLTLLHVAWLIVMPPVQVPLAAVIVMLASALLAGAVSSLLRVALSARLSESLVWWRAACERERVALAAKSEFLNTMSHELRSPLHVIVGYAEVVADQVASPLRPPLERIRTSALDLLQLVENTMNAARLEAGKLQVHLESFDPAVVLRELAENVATLPEAVSSVAVRWVVPSTLSTVQLDRLKLKEIVQNLVSNALKFTRTGEVVVEVAELGSSLRIVVRDSGPGIPPEAQARMFEMFERHETGTDHRPPGVGLGLYIVRGLVDLMGGRIGVQSALGVGTEFTVELPLQPGIRTARAA